MFRYRDREEVYFVLHSLPEPEPQENVSGLEKPPPAPPILLLSRHPPRKGQKSDDESSNFIVLPKIFFEMVKSDPKFHLDWIVV